MADQYEADQSRRTVVTGAVGFIGGNLVKRLATFPWASEVVFIDDLPTGSGAQRPRIVFILTTQVESALQASAVDAGVQTVAFMDGKTAACHLWPTEFRLRKTADERTVEEPTRRTTGDHREAIRVRAATQKPLPLAAVVDPTPQRDTSELVLEKLSKKDAKLALVSFPALSGGRTLRCLTRSPSMRQLSPTSYRAAQQSFVAQQSVPPAWLKLGPDTHKRR